LLAPYLNGFHEQTSREKAAAQLLSVLSKLRILEAEIYA